MKRKPINFIRVTKDQMPKARPEGLPNDDLVREVVDASEIRYEEGLLLLTVKGLRQLCNAVLSGRLDGNKERASQMLSQLSSFD